MSSSQALRGAAVGLVIFLVGCSPAIPSVAPPSSRTPAPSPSHTAVLFVVSFHDVAEGEYGETRAVVPGTFCLGYLARVVTAGTYRWQPAVARRATSPGLVATTPAATLELR
ncbi:MAG TPA: hypothetical protein VER83_05395 [Candidatus Nanopelagicales bacterium]|nr:hypothetical protein [Candidatus Nanopelagicales bacterium]